MTEELYIGAAVGAICHALQTGKKVMFCGNGGSAAIAQHLAAELMGRFKIDRKPLAALSLTTDTSAITAIGNDYGFDQIFSRQIEGLGEEGDVLVAMSTSGKSSNIIRACLVASEKKITVIFMAGRIGMDAYSVAPINVDSDDTAFIQEEHLRIGHLICGAVEQALNVPE